MTPKEDQQPMTTREEFKQAWRERPWRHKDESAKDIAFSWWEAGRLASRQEVSVEELAMSMHSTCASVIVPQGEEIVARALLAEYSITKRS